MYISLKDRFRSSIKYFRFKNKLSQEQLAELADLTEKYISDVERGRATPSFDTVDRIAEAFEVDSLELLTDKYYEEYANNKIKIDKVRGRIKRGK
ncbi:MAG: helix-turn-helix transcriptional regulator [Bacilli bacterium]|nr:helix-turn-helix transcriptional regulator [Bacilli bacterium]